VLLILSRGFSLTLVSQFVGYLTGDDVSREFGGLGLFYYLDVFKYYIFFRNLQIYKMFILESYLKKEQHLCQYED
jgi:hypothetical protein